MELSEQEVIRRESLQKMKDMGINPYPADEYVVTGYSTEIKATFEDENQEAEWYNGKPVRIAGRLMSRRIMGKASFIELQDSKGRIQVYVSRDDIQAPTPEGETATTAEQQMYNVVFKKLLDIGDFIGIEGFTFRTQMGMSVTQYIRVKKILYAQALIQNGLPPTLAAQYCSYDNYSTFYRNYKKILLHSPEQDLPQWFFCIFLDLHVVFTDPM